MTKISDALTYGLTIRESATDGSDFTNPAADYRRLFLGEDGQLHVRDSAGTVTAIGAASGSVATDAIWDAAGDLAVGTGADTAAKLTKGAAGGVLAMGNSAVIWNAGTSFPASKATGDRYWRTDLGMEFYWDGTRWVSTTLYVETVGSASDTLGNTNSDGVGFGRLPTWGSTTLGAPQYDWWIEGVDFGYVVNVTNDGSKYWTLTLRKIYQATYSGTVTSVTTSAATAGEWQVIYVVVNALLGIATQLYDTLDLLVVKTSTPGSLYATARVRYRIVAT